MMKVAGLLSTVTVAVALWPAAIRAQRSRLFGLPAEFARYTEWAQLLKEPHKVAPDLSVLCAAPPPPDSTAARPTHGPHGNHFIRVYSNQSAAAVSERERRPLPTGAVIAKEKLPGSSHAAPDGVAFMIKRKASQFPETAGWEFLFFPQTEAPARTHEACASCHRAAASKDFVFGQYPN